MRGHNISLQFLFGAIRVKFVQDLMPELVTCKFEGDLSKLKVPFFLF